MTDSPTTQANSITALVTPAGATQYANANKATSPIRGLTLPRLNQGPSWDAATQKLALDNGWGKLPTTLEELQKLAVDSGFGTSFTVWDATAQQLATDNGWGLLPTPTNNIWNASLTQAANAHGLYALDDWNANAQQLAANNGWGLLPTATNNVWDASLTQAANAHGLYAHVNEVPNVPTQFTQRLVDNTRSAAAERSYLKKGCRMRNANNQKAPGQVKVHYGRRTFQRTNGRITMAHVRIKRGNDNTRAQDNIYLPSMSRPTDQVRHAEYMADAMDSIPVQIGNHRFHHERVVDALDRHAERSHQYATDAIAEHDGHGSGLAVGFTDP